MNDAERTLDTIARRLWGPTWAMPLHGFTGLNIRTCKRLHADLTADKPNRQALGALLALKDALKAAVAEIDTNAGAEGSEAQ